MRDVVGYEGLYAVTSCGRVWSYRRNKFLSQVTNKYGYKKVVLHKNGEAKNFTVHRLVASAYIPNPDNLSQVNHKDEVKTHNWINNLEWCTQKYNNTYGTRIERQAEKVSIKIQCVETKEVFSSLTDCERKTGCNHSDISQHLRGKKCKSIKGYHFIKI